jgi:ribosomal protein L31E
MTTFLISIWLLLINGQLNGLKTNAIGAIITMRNLKCKVYDRKTLAKEAIKKIKNIIEKTQILMPTEINIG